MTDSPMRKFLGKSTTFHGTLGVGIDELKWGHEIPDSDDGVLRHFKVTLILNELDVPEGQSRISVFFEKARRAEVESFLGKEVLLECRVVGGEGRGFGPDLFGSFVTYRHEAELIAIRQP